MTSFDQHRYQVRLEWGAAGIARLAPADVVVIVDVLPTVEDPPGVGRDAARIVAVAESTGARVVHGDIRTAGAVARELLAEQGRRAARTSISVIAAGEQTSDGGMRVTVEDLLGAGAIIDALGALGIDHTSPEAAAACEAYRGLRPALRHLLAASGSGLALSEAGGRDRVHAAAIVDATAENGSPAEV
ncbi:2-phosphosulfolactate phosphatase [Microbacterium koreense]|uniref:Probable 2-phosphosulfolactate phosphatase n=1 Tax=Microbacterium koreense TaxID=323761 RepID=A0ABW2ZM96_9MICO